MTLGCLELMVMPVVVDYLKVIAFLFRNFWFNLMWTLSVQVLME